jgi:hypothetical protein
LRAQHARRTRHPALERSGGEVLERAAALAAWYSDGRGSTTAPVDVTERRHVASRGGPGMVTYRHERTLNVRPRSERISISRVRDRAAGLGAGNKMIPTSYSAYIGMATSIM